MRVQQMREPLNNLVHSVNYIALFTENILSAFKLLITEIFSFLGNQTKLIVRKTATCGTILAFMKMLLYTDSIYSFRSIVTAYVSAPNHKVAINIIFH